MTSTVTSYNGEVFTEGMTSGHLLDNPLSLSGLQYAMLGGKLTLQIALDTSSPNYKKMVVTKSCSL